MNITSCLVSAILIGSSLFTMISSKNSQVFKNFQATLTPEQQVMYKQITGERLNVYITGLLLGTVLSMGYLYYNLSTNKGSTVTDSCIYTTIMLVTLYIYYNMMPKSKYMLNYLTTKNQTDAWLEVYKFMQKRSNQGMLLGALGYFLLYNSFNTSKSLE